MRWLSIEEMADLAPLPDGYSYGRLSRGEVPAFIQAIKQWHPDIVVGAGSCYLREDFYHDKVFLDGEAERDIQVFLFKHDGRIVGMWSWEREPDTLSMYGRLMVIAPEHRNSKIASTAVAAAERLGRAMGAEYLYSVATLKHPYAQLATERAGFQLLGFMPGYDREVGEDGVIKRVYEAVYAMVLVPKERLLRPESKNLSPKAKALFELLFPAEDDSNLA